MRKKGSIQTFAKRRALILEELEANDIVKVEDLSHKLGVSVVTIRKDLDLLDLEGRLERIHGGAVKNYRMQQTQSFVDQMNLHKAAKCQIAAAAAKLVNSGESVILNSGSTTCYIAEELCKKKDVLVITNSFHVFNITGHCRTVTTLFLGGRYDSEHQISYDEDAIEQLSKYKAEKLFLGMDGIDLESGATTYTHTSTAITKKMMECAKQKILVVDDSKIQKTALVHIAALTEFDLLITKATPENAAILEAIRQRGLNVLAV